MLLLGRVAEARVVGPGDVRADRRVWAGWVAGGGRGRGGDFAGVVYVSACSGALVWSVVGRAVWRSSLPSFAAAAGVLQTSVHIWSVARRGYASSGLRPTQRKTLWMAWYPQGRECCDLGGGPSACLGLPRVACRFEV